MFEIWGVKTIAFFDVWSIEHVLSGISFGTICSNWVSKNITSNAVDKIKVSILALLCISFFWESLEHYIEEGLCGEAVKIWFQGVEHWSNRLISDNLAVLLGAFISYKWRKLVTPARILSAIWLYIHIFVFPHSMYLHELF